MALLVAVAFLAAGPRLLDRMGFRKSPELMSERAREVLGHLGYSAEPVGTAQGFSIGRHVMRWILKNDSSPQRFEKLPADTMLFWYRGSPRPMAPTAFDVFDQPALRVTREDPAMRVPGMSFVYLNAAGRLAELMVVPPQREDDAGPTPAFDWKLLFSEAGIDPSRYTPVEPRWQPLTYADARAAWEGPHPDRPEIRARIEAAAYRGRPVSFFVIAPWDYPALQAPYSPTTGEIAGLWAFYTLFLAILVAAVVLARRNLRLERGDRAGAVRLCVAAIVRASLPGQSGAPIRLRRTS